MLHSADTRPDNHLIRSLVVDRDSTFSLKIRCPNEGLTILRFLVTKFYARGTRLTQHEEVILYYMVEYFENLRNNDFFTSNQRQWLTVKMLVGLYIERKHQKERAYINQVKILVPQIAMTPRAFLGYQKLFKVDKFLCHQNRKLQKDHAPQRRIGVGYRDKGAARIDHYDASPSWQEVALVTSRTQKIEPLRCKEKFFQTFRAQFSSRFILNIN